MKRGTLKHALAERGAKSALFSAARLYSKAIRGAERALEDAAEEGDERSHAAAKDALTLAAAAGDRLEAVAMRFADLSPGRKVRKARRKK